MLNLKIMARIAQGALVASLLATAGCSRLLSPLMGSSASSSNSNALAAKQVQPTYLPSSIIDGPTSGHANETPPTANVFGEFNGVERAPAALVADTNLQQHTFTEEGYDADVNVDPSGKWLVFSSTRNSPHPDIYMQRVDGNSVIQLTTDPADNVQPVFSPDGKSIVFCSNRAGNWNLYQMDTDGGNVVQLTDGTSQCVHPSFSPDGTQIVYSAIGGRSNQWELWVMNMNSKEQKMIGYGLFPCWSPRKDVDRIAFQRARQRGTRWFSVWTLDLVNGEAKRLTEVAVSSNAAIVSPSWSNDAEKLAFSTIVDPTRTKDGKPLGQQDIWVCNADGSDRHRLTDASGMNLSPCWSVDNNVFFISDRSGAECVWSIRVDQGKTTTAKQDQKNSASDPSANSAVGAVDISGAAR